MGSALRNSLSRRKGTYISEHIQDSILVMMRIKTDVYNYILTLCLVWCQVLSLDNVI